MNGELVYNLSLDEVKLRLIDALAPSGQILNSMREGANNE